MPIERHNSRLKFSSDKRVDSAILYKKHVPLMINAVLIHKCRGRTVVDLELPRKAALIKVVSKDRCLVEAEDFVEGDVILLAGYGDANAHKSR